jgi:hypothetical protein
MISLGATSVDLILLIMIIVLGTVSFYIHLAAKKEAKLREEKFWNEINQLRERYHRLDALNFAMAKVLQTAREGSVSIVEESANGDGDYTLDRKF